MYRVIQTDQGGLLSQTGVLGTHANHVAQAVQTINGGFRQPLVVEDLARGVNMSVSAFHKHFLAVTGMSPLQYQKTVRLQEARRLLLAEGLAASEAAFRVGYESPSQFSREYARLFGQPPARHALYLQRALSTALAHGGIVDEG